MSHEKGFVRRKVKPDVEMDITPMIDVTFLLLIFFLVTSTMAAKTPLQLPPAKNGAGVSENNSIVLSVFKGDPSPQVYLSDGKPEHPALGMSEVTEYVRQGYAAGEGKRLVIIKADRDVPAGFVEEVARAAAEVSDDLQFYVGVMDQKR